MKSRLLARNDLEKLAEAVDMPALIAALAETPYVNAIEKALARASDLACVALALRLDLESVMARLQRFFSGRAAEAVNVVLRSYDVANLKTVLRGLSQGIATAEIVSAFVPGGTLPHDLLVELAEAPDVRAAIDTLASAGSPLARPLLRLRSERPGATTVEMELSLDKWYYDQALAFARSERGGEQSLLAALELNADVLNILTALRLAQDPHERQWLQEWMATEDVTRLFVHEGRLSHRLLLQAAQQESVGDAGEVMAKTRYGPVLLDALAVYGTTQRLSVFEEQLHRYTLRWRSNLINRDPLGTGVVLGYLSLKQNEIRNLRWIADAVYVGMDPDTIQAELVYAP